MTSSLLAAIHAACADPAGENPEETATGAHALQNQEDSMSDKNPKAGAGNAGGDTDNHEQALAQAEERGRESGAIAERTRLAAVLTADGIKGDGGRMAAALDLAVKSPAMSAEDIGGFVTANVAAAGDKGKPNAAQYEAGRMQGAGLAGPGNGGTPEKSGLSRLIAAQIGA